MKQEVRANALSVFFPLQVFDDLQKMLNLTNDTVEQSDVSIVKVLQRSPIMQLTVGLCVSLTIGLGFYIL